MARITLPSGLVLDEADLGFRFVHASGPGGQNVNKVATAVELRFDSRGVSGLPEGLLARLPRLAGQRMTQEGVIIILAQSFRSQLRNREDALARLDALLLAAAEVPRRRRPTRPTRGSQERRLDGKAKRAGIKKLRGAPME
ncbi:alternative ribosome rescue aminoacyl-tRNA hydrolase ArfB [Acidisoma sp. C75]